MEKPSLLVYGDASVDISLRIAYLPAAGLDSPASDPLVTVGGAAANTATVAARLGARVNLVARVGNDLFTDLITEDLVRHGVRISGVQITEGPSALVVALIDPGGQRTFVSSRGPARGLVAPDTYLPLLDEAGMVHLIGYCFQDPGSRSTALHLRDEARRRGIPISLDPSALFAERYRTELDWLEEIDYLFPSRQEATALTGLTSPKDAALQLLGLGVKTVVITMGAEGCLIQDRKSAALIPAVTGFPVVDTNGAGDAFVGGFFGVLLAGGSPGQAARVGALVAARIITEAGAHTASPSVEELQRLAEALEDEETKKAVEVLAPTQGAAMMKEV